MIQFLSWHIRYHVVAYAYHASSVIEMGILFPFHSDYRECEGKAPANFIRR